MYPDLFSIGKITIHTYGLMMAIGFLVSYFILKYEIKRLGDDPELASDIIFWGAIGGIAGSKLFFIIENFALVIKDPIHTIFSGSGLAFHGGLIFGTFIVILVIKKNKKDVGVYADIISPLLLVGQGLGRIGCFFAGCCHGKVTSCFWGVSYPPESHASYYQSMYLKILDSPALKSLPVHPTQLCEAFLNFVFFFILVKLIRPCLKRTWATFAIYLIFAGFERFLLEFIRINPKGFLGLTNYQYSSLFLFIVGIVILLFFTKPKTQQY
jgi:phosphatidylglycerol:prolipoprotein diacylglycerol transferase